MYVSLDISKKKERIMCLKLLTIFSQQEGVLGPVTIYKDFILSYQQLCEVGSMILFYT